MTLHHPITPAVRVRSAALIGEIALAPHRSGLHPRGRLAVIATLALWLWAVIASIGYLAFG